jgi:hypothetical protein
LYGIFAFMAYNGDENAWKVLLLDVTIGFSAWVNHKLTPPFEPCRTSPDYLQGPTWPNID